MVILLYHTRPSFQLLPLPFIFTVVLGLSVFMIILHFSFPASSFYLLVRKMKYSSVQLSNFGIRGLFFSVSTGLLIYPF